MINKFSSRKGILSRGKDIIITPPKTGLDLDDVIVYIGGDKYIPSRSDKLLSVKATNTVKGGERVILKWAYPNIAKVGSPCRVFIGNTPFWSGFISQSNELEWRADPLQGVLQNIFYYDPDYQNITFEGKASKLVLIALEFAIQEAPYLSLGEIVVGDDIVQYDINSKTIAEILEFVSSQFNEFEAVYGVDNDFKCYFKNIQISNPNKIQHTDYGGEISISVESDNVVTVLSVFKNRKVKIINDDLNEEFIYPVSYIGKVGIGVDPISKGNYPPVSNYYRFGHIEDRYEIDAPDMTDYTALSEAYKVLKNYQVTNTYTVTNYNYKGFPIAVGPSQKIITKDNQNISLYLDLTTSAVIVSGTGSGSISVINETPINESYGGDSLAIATLRLSDIEAWREQVSLVDQIKEISVGFLCNFNGTISIVDSKNNIEIVTTVRPSLLIQYVTFNSSELMTFDKSSIQISSTGTIKIINLYAIANSGQSSYTGYLRSVKLESSKKGDLFTLEVQSYNSLPILTFQKLQDQIRKAKSIALK